MPTFRAEVDDFFVSSMTISGFVCCKLLKGREPLRERECVRAWGGFGDGGRRHRVITPSGQSILVQKREVISSDGIVWSD